MVEENMNQEDKVNKYQERKRKDKNKYRDATRGSWPYY